MKTHILFVLDESGSMQPKANDVVNGFNRYVQDQKAGTDECVLSLVKFNTTKSRVYTCKPINDAPELSYATYVPGGSTALLDAVAESIRIGDEEPSDRVICVIVTDGEENASRETSQSQVAAIMKEREDSGKWTFAYLGESPERWSQTMGTSVNNTMQYNAGNIGSQLDTLSCATVTMRSTPMTASANFLSVPATPSNSDAAKQLGSAGGKIGGPARVAATTPQQRIETARKVSRARWDSVTKKGE